MAFNTQRGRPRKPASVVDLGTPELRMKHALRITAEPIDLCLERGLISEDQHWSGLHLRWLYTLRYGAPSLTTHYSDRSHPREDASDDVAWKAMREGEYREASALLKSRKRYECVMRLAIHNERPAFLDTMLLKRAQHHSSLAQSLNRMHNELSDGLQLLAKLWGRRGLNDIPATNAGTLSKMLQ